MRLYIVAMIKNFCVGYSEFMVSSSYKDWKECVGNVMVENGADIIIVSAGRYINCKVIDKDNFKVEIMSEGAEEYLENCFKIIR